MVNVYDDVMKSYKALGYAVVVRAVDDYKRSIKVIRKYNGVEIPSEKLPNDLILAKKLIKDCENFFNGDLISIYCEYDGKKLLKLLQEKLSIR